jgi:phosphomannomutase
MIGPELRSRVTAWIADDPDERDRAELTALLADQSRGAVSELIDRFGGRLEFGTAGLRGAVAAGPNRMNRAVVRAATAALASRLLQGASASSHHAAVYPGGVYPGAGHSAVAEAGPRQLGALEAGVVIGCDARHRSDEFADEAARVLAGAGIRVMLLPFRQPTPLLAFAIRHLGAAAGIMITASHNPRGDNGYKLYLGDGAQIVPPADIEIEAAIRALGPLADVPVADPDSPLITQLSDEVARAYLDALCGISPGPPGAAWLRFVYTPLHGVAGGLALRAFEQAGYSDPDVVEAQAAPDPDFPTVTFPNPEEPGALDLALALARRSGADLVIANDPDGDRLAVAIPDPGVPGGWRTLTGDQVGALLGAYLLDRFPAPRAGRGDDRLLVSTIVSATMLARIAAATGARYALTLTGFKWIVRAGESQPDARFVFGYEEALGYAVTDIVRDKDGIGAALAILGLATRARSAGESLLEAYDALETAHGVHLTAQLTMTTAAPADVTARLRAAAPTFLGRTAVTSVTDLTGGRGELPSADVLIYKLAGDRVVIRPSGTEPKLKAYLEIVEPVTAGRLAEARRTAAARLGPLREAVRDLLAR